MQCNLDPINSSSKMSGPFLTYHRVHAHIGYAHATTSVVLYILTIINIMSHNPNFPFPLFILLQFNLSHI